MLLSGQGVAQDYAEAVKWWSLAADQGIPEAQFSLAMCYAKGHGVPRSDENAIMLLKEAAARGYQPAANVLGQLGR